MGDPLMVAEPPLIGALVPMFESTFASSEPTKMVRIQMKLKIKDSEALSSSNAVTAMLSPITPQNHKGKTVNAARRSGCFEKQ